MIFPYHKCKHTEGTQQLVPATKYRSRREGTPSLLFLCSEGEPYVMSAQYWVENVPSCAGFGVEAEVSAGFPGGVLLFSIFFCFLVSLCGAVSRGTPPPLVLYGTGGVAANPDNTVQSK